MIQTGANTEELMREWEAGADNYRVRKRRAGGCGEQEGKSGDIWWTGGEMAKS